MWKNLLFCLLAFAFALKTARSEGCYLNMNQNGCDICWFRSDGSLLNCAGDWENRCTFENGDCSNPSSCFPGNTIVTLETGAVIKMSDVKIGDKVATVSPSGGYMFSEVRAFMHRETNIKASYLRLETSSGNNILLSHSHVIFMGKSNESTHMENRFAEDVDIGDFIFHVDQYNDIIPEMVISKSVETMEGAYAPLTTEGTLLVNDIYASCYAAGSHNIAHILMTPMRWFPSIFDSNGELQGARPFVNFMKQIGIYILPDQYKTRKYRSNDQKVIGVYEKLSNWQQKCAAMKQDYNMFAIHATCQK